MTAARATHSASPARPDLVNRVADHVRQYPWDLVDAKRLMKRFAVSAHEFHQALLRSHPAGEKPTVPPPAPTPCVLSAMVHRVVAHLLQYPEDIVDTKRLLTRLRVSADEFQQAHLCLDRYSHSV